MPGERGGRAGPVAAELTALADRIAGKLGNEYADRQYICEEAERQLRDIAARMPGPDSMAGLGQREVLRLALGDAIAYRDPAGVCLDCDVHPARLCEDHAADLGKTDSYLALARVAVAVLGWLGRPAEKPFVQPAIVSAKAERLTPDIIIRALGSLSLSGIDKVLREGREITFVSPVVRDGPGGGWRSTCPTA